MRFPQTVFASVFVGVLLAAACAPPAPEACTAEGAGKGSARRLTFRELPAPPPGLGVCRTLAKVVRTEAELRAEYDALKMPGDLPPVDFTKEIVIVFSSDNGSANAWQVEDGDEVAIGTARCSETGALCNDFVFAVETRATKVQLYTCETVSCSRPL